VSIRKKRRKDKFVTVMGPASVYGTLSLTAQCNDVQCCSHSMFIIVIGNDDLEQRLTFNLPCAKGVWLLVMQCQLCPQHIVY
jgi:hypothetical protein